MSITPSQSAGIAQLIALASFIDHGSDSAKIVFYSDTKPTSTTVAANNSATLVTLMLEKPCLLSSNTSSINLKPTDAEVAISGGVATWARLYNGNNIVVADFEVGTDILLSDEIAEGSILSMTSITLTPIQG